MRLWHRKAAAISVGALAMLGGPAAVAEAATSTIVVHDGSKDLTFRRFAGGTVASFLKANGIQVSPQDRVYPSLDTPVRGSMEIDIEHPKRVWLQDGDGREQITTFARTVAELLAAQGIELGPLDRINVSPQSAVQDEMVIQIQRVTRTVVRSKHPIPFQTVRRKTSDLYAGETRVLTRGVEGWLATQTVTMYVNGRKTRTVTTRQIISQPVTQVILVGTRPRPDFVALHPSRDAGVGHFLCKLTVVATAYVQGGRTATGTPARPGVIAVDPSVIPLGSHVYIPGFGEVVAADTGGAIRGDRIDICVATERQAEDWGRRVITIYVLSEPSQV